MSVDILDHASVGRGADICWKVGYTRNKRHQSSYDTIRSVYRRARPRGPVHSLSDGVIEYVNTLRNLRRVARTRC